MQSTGLGLDHNYTNTSIADGSYTVNFYCIDINGNSNNSEIEYFSKDTSIPQLSIIYPGNQTYIVNVSNLNYTYNDTNPDSCWYSRNGGGVNSSIVAAGTNFTFVTSIEGSNTYNLYCNDTSGNANYSEVVVFWKDTVNPSVLIDIPGNTTYTNSYIEFNITTNENSSCYYSLDSGVVNNSMIGNSSGTGHSAVNDSIADGSYNVSVYCNDTLGNRNDSEIQFFSKDTTALSITKNLPENVTYSQDYIEFNISTNKEASCKYSLDSGFVNVSMDPTTEGTGHNATNTSIADGSYTVDFYCNDSIGSIDIETEDFSKDTVIPQLSIIYPGNQTYIVNVSNLNYTLFDEGAFSECWYTTDLGETNTTINCGDNVTEITSNEGSNTWIVYANDTANNINSSSVVFWKDTVNPSVLIDVPGNTTYTNSYIEFNITTSENSSCYYSLDSGVTNNTMTGNSSGTGHSALNDSIADGSYNVSVYCNDTLGNRNDSEIQFFSKDTIVPWVNLTSPGNATSLTAGTISFQFNITDSGDIENCSLIIDNSIVSSSSSITKSEINAIQRSMPAGTYVWNVNCTDSGNNIGNSSSRTLTITGGDDSCFPAGTKILMADNTEKNIEDVELGEYVVSYDFKNNKKTIAEVLELESPVREGYYQINNILNVTDEHPFYTLRRNGEKTWTAINDKKAEKDLIGSELEGINVFDLTIGDKLYTSDNQWVRVKTIKYVPGEIKTYNLKTVDKYNVFFANNILVHNKDGGPGGCTDQCDAEGNEETECYNITAARNRTCGNFDADSCLDWSDWEYDFCEECSGGACTQGLSEISITLLSPLEDFEVGRHGLFNISFNVSCLTGNCGDVEVSLDPLTDYFLGQYYNNKNFQGDPVLVRNDEKIDFNWKSGSPCQEVNKDQFSVRWLKEEEFLKGKYEFTTVSDDGVKLWIDNILLINRWNDHSAKTDTEEIILDSGIHSIKLDYYENRGQARAELKWKALEIYEPGFCIDGTKEGECNIERLGYCRNGTLVDNCSVCGCGLGLVCDEDDRCKINYSDFPDYRAEYYNNKNLQGDIILVRNDEKIDFNWKSGSPVKDFNEDTFSVRWTKDFDLPQGKYLFTTLTDDGVKLWVNNELVIDDWRDHSAKTNTAELVLDSGLKNIEMNYYENRGQARVKFSYDLLEVYEPGFCIDGTKEGECNIKKPGYCENGELVENCDSCGCRESELCSENGKCEINPELFPDYRAEYYNNKNLQGNPDLVRNDPMIDFNWKSGSPDSEINKDLFSVRWTKHEYFSSGKYKFTTVSDDGVRLWVDGILILERWNDHSAKTDTGFITLDSGNHEIVMEYYENRGQARANLSWELVEAISEAYWGKGEQKVKVSEASITDSVRMIVDKYEGEYRIELWEHDLFFDDFIKYFNSSDSDWRISLEDYERATEGELEEEAEFYFKVISFDKKILESGILIVNESYPEYRCDYPEQLIMKLSGEKFAQAEMWSQDNYRFEVCFDDLFGYEYEDVTRECTGENKVVGLKNVTASKAEIPESDSYEYDVCYGNLNCSSREECFEGEVEVLRLNKTSDSRLSYRKGEEYPVKICCSSERNVTEPYFGDSFLRAINLTFNSKKINLVWKIKNPGIERKFEVYRKRFSILSLFGDERVEEIIPEQVDGTLMANWQASEPGIYYFVAYSDGFELESHKIEVYPAGDINPEIIIESPSNNSYYIIDEEVNFTEYSYDADGEIIYVEWNISNGILVSESSFLHSFNESGIYNVGLRVMDNEGLNSTEILKISVTKSKSGLISNITGHSHFYITSGNPVNPLIVSLQEGESEVVEWEVNATDLGLYRIFAYANKSSDKSVSDVSESIIVNTIQICVPDCSGKECGGDGCGGSCGNCFQGESCVEGFCQGSGGPPGPVGCIDQCDEGENESQCYNETSLRTRICGEYDDDSCLDWSEWNYTCCREDAICDNQSLRCISDGCSESWNCGNWGECINGVRSRVCVDENNCGTTYNLPEQGQDCYSDGCVPDLVCPDWQECDAYYTFEDIIQGKPYISGETQRICEDREECEGPLMLQEKSCSLEVPIEIEKVKWCYEKYLEIYEVSSGRKLVSRIKEKEVSGTKQIDVNFIVGDFSGYCDFCYDGIQNYDEERVDCGGSCPSCVETPQKKTFLGDYIFSFLWILLLILIIILAYIIYKRLREKIKEKKQGEKSEEDKKTVKQKKSENQ
jgi:hypothetical protein